MSDDKSLNFSDSDLDILSDLLSEEGIDLTRDERAIQPRDPNARVPLSFAQEMLYLLDQASPGLTAYNLGTAKRIVGNLDVPALERALSKLAERHEVLRSRFGTMDGEPVQIVDAPAPVTLNIIESSAAGLERLLVERARTPFNLTTDHLYRPTLVRVSPTDHVLVLETHHAIADGWSMGLMIKEVAELYRAEKNRSPANLPALRVQFGDYAIWQRDTLKGKKLQDLLDFWRKQLGESREPLNLPTDFPVPATPTFAGAVVAEFMPPEELERLKAFGRAHDATLYMLLLAAYATVLHRYSGRDIVIVGSGVANRADPDIQGLIGYFNNTLAQKADFTGDPTIAELLARVRESALGAYDHQEVPLEKLVLDLNQGADRTNDTSLFQCVFTMQDPIGSTLQMDGLETSTVSVQLGATKFDITFLPSERDGGLRLSVHYRSDLFTEARMHRFLAHLRNVFNAMVTDANVRVSAIPLLSDEERAVIAKVNDTAADVGMPATVVELFEAQAARVPDRLAVVGRPSALGGPDAAEHLTYAELNARANQLAYRLREKGVKANSPVGLALDRSTDAVVGILGILKAGGAYVPLPPELPPARLHAQLSESGATVVVSIAAHASKLPADVALVALDAESDTLHAEPVANPVPAAKPDDLAYVLFTSGSTGTPKGVAVTHFNIVSYTQEIARILGDVDGLHFAQVSTFGADLGNTSLYPALLNGATLHVLPAAVTTEPERFADYMAKNAIDIIKLTPSHLRALTAGATGADLARLLPKKWLVLGGEATSVELGRTLLSAGTCRVLNHYGPTETTVGALTFEATNASLDEVAAQGAQTVPIGRPLPNTVAFVVDGRQSEQPLAIPGELLIGGAGVTRGYLGRDDLTKERFIAHNGLRVYRTGDRVRRLANGAIEFLGRVDDQVKVRGYRVELGEIAHVLCSHPHVKDATVIVRHDTDEPALVAYVVDRRDAYGASHGEKLDHALTQWLSERLPDYMVPHSVVTLDAIPLTANGKVDRAKLPAPQVTAVDTIIAPRTETEQKLAAIWKEVLKKDEVGINQNFIDLGGHSLLAIRILGKISKTLGVRLSLRTLFEAPTVESLAELLDVERQLAAIEALDATP